MPWIHGQNGDCIEEISSKRIMYGPLFCPKYFPRIYYLYIKRKPHSVRAILLSDIKLSPSSRKKHGKLEKVLCYGALQMQVWLPYIL
jgi:hypothetical protein